MSLRVTVSVLTHHHRSAPVKTTKTTWSMSGKEIMFKRIQWSKSRYAPNTWSLPWHVDVLEAVINNSTLTLARSDEPREGYHQFLSSLRCFIAFVQHSLIPRALITAVGITSLCIWTRQRRYPLVSVWFSGRSVGHTQDLHPADWSSCPRWNQSSLIFS